MWDNRCKIAVSGVGYSKVSRMADKPLAAHALEADVRLYETLFTKEDPNDVEEGQDFTANLNPLSLEVLKGCKLEPCLAEAAVGDHFQFERLGYFCVDQDSTPGNVVFNRTVTLKDAWVKIEKKTK